MTRERPVAYEYDLLEQVMNEMQQGSCAVLPVLRGDRLVGLIVGTPAIFALAR